MAKKAKKETAGKAAGRKRGRKDPTATAVGAGVGLLLVAWACLQLVQGRGTLLDTAKLAVAAAVVALIVEKVVFPLGRALVGPPQEGGRADSKGS